MSYSSQSQKHKRVIIFDFDGVLADSFSLFYFLIRDAMDNIGLSLTPDQYRDFFVGNVHQSFKNFINDNVKLRIFLDFREKNYDKYYHPRLFSGAKHFLNKIKVNYTLAVASSGKKNSIINIMKQHGIYGMFKIICATSETTKKNMIDSIIRKLGAMTQETIFVTDTVGDIIMAKESGLRTIAVTWGFHPRKTLESAKPEYIATSFEILYKKLGTVI